MIGDVCIEHALLTNEQINEVIGHAVTALLCR